MTLKNYLTTEIALTTKTDCDIDEGGIGANPLSLKCMVTNCATKTMVYPLCTLPELLKKIESGEVDDTYILVSISRQALTEEDDSKPLWNRSIVFYVI